MRRITLTILFFLALNSIKCQGSFPCEISVFPFKNLEIKEPAFSPERECIGNRIHSSTIIPLRYDEKNFEFDWYTSTIQTINGNQYEATALTNIRVAEGVNRIFCWGNFTNHFHTSAPIGIFIFDLKGNLIKGIESNLGPKCIVKVSS